MNCEECGKAIVHLVTVTVAKVAKAVTVTAPPPADGPTVYTDHGFCSKECRSAWMSRRAEERRR